VFVIGLVMLIVGVVLLIAGAVAGLPAVAVQVGWALFAVGLILVVVALVLNGVDSRDTGRSSWGWHADALRSSWGLLLVAPGLRKRLRASWGGPEA
jgi:uncharacterized membrane protein HdeD (DUF308 family)